MHTELTKLEKNMVELAVEVGPEELAQAMNRAVSRLSAKVRIPGFRPGKAPRAVLERRLGVEALQEEAFNALFPEAYSKAVKEHQLDPITQPEVSDIVIEAGKPCTFKVKVEVMPETKLGEYKGLTATKRVLPVTDADVAEVLGHLAERQTELVVSETEKVAKGMYAIIDFEGFIDDAPFSGGAGKDVSLEVGSGRFLPGFEEGIEGAKRNETRDVKVTFPADYRAEHLAGKEATFKITVKEIKEKRVPPIDDDFAKTVSDFATLDELKADIRKRVAEERDKEADGQVENQLIAAAATNGSVEVPETLVNRRVETKFAEFLNRLRDQGYTLQDYLGEERTEADLKKDLAASAREELKTRLVLEAIVKAEGITATPEELDAKLLKLANGNEENAARFRQQLEKEGRLDSLTEQVAVEKAIDLLVTNAKVEVSEVSAKTAGAAEAGPTSKPKAKRAPRVKKAAAEAVEASKED